MKRACVALLVLGTMTGCKGSMTDADEFSVTPAQSELSVGGTVQLSAIDAPGPVTWSSNRTDVATVVPETGFVTAVGRGEATISAVAGSSVASATITVREPPTIALSQASAVLETLHGSGAPAPVTVGIMNTGDDPIIGLAVGMIEYGQGQASGWLSAQLAGAPPGLGSAGQLAASGGSTDLVLSANVVGLAAGFYDAVVTIQAANAVNTVELPVTLRLLTPPTIELSRTAVTLTAIPGEVGQDMIEVTNGGTASMAGLQAAIAYQGGPQGWLTASLSSSSPPADLVLEASSAGLDPDTYNAVVAISSATPGVASRQLQVTFILSPGPAIDLNPNIAAFNATPGSPAPPAQNVQVGNGGGGTLTGLGTGAIQYQGGANGWLSAVLNGTSAPTTLTLSVDHAGLPEAAYTATVPITSPVASNSPASLTVTLTVGPPPEISPITDFISQASFVGGADPAAFILDVTNSGGGVLGEVEAAITAIDGPGNWLDLAWLPPNEVTPANPTARLQVRSRLPGLTRGTYHATVEISAPGTSAAPKQVNVTFFVYTFAADIYPIFDTTITTVYGTATCASGGCHSIMGSTVASRYAWAHDPSRVTPFNLSHAASPLYCKVSSGSTCPAAMPLDAVRRNLIAIWITSGAPN